MSLWNTAAARLCFVATLALIAGARLLNAQTVPLDAPYAGATVVYQPQPSFDLSSMDAAADPCTDFYKFACGHYAQNHPIPPDQNAADSFYTLFNVNTQQLSGLLEQYARPTPGRTPDEQKIGDEYHACMNTAAIEQKGLEPLRPLLKRIDSVGLLQLPALIGELERIGVGVFFRYGEQQDDQDASKQIAYIDQGGLGLPEKDFYLRAGAKDEEIRKAYVDYLTRMLALSGAAPGQATRQAANIMSFETELAKVSQGNVERRDPNAVYHLAPISTVAREFPFGTLGQFDDAIHSPHVSEINDVNPAYVPALVGLIRATDLDTLRAYMRVRLLSAFALALPKRFDDARFDFYGRVLNGLSEPRARWKRCSDQVNQEVGEALGHVYVERYFAGDSKQKTLEMVGDIEHAMDRDIEQLDWMSAATKARAKEKLHQVANKIGYPEHFRDYSALIIAPDDAAGNIERSNAFENDRQLHKIGKPVDHGEWGMTPPTVNAYYDSSMNDINFPAGILQPNFYDSKADDAVNYGHIGAVIGHELTHGFDDEGKKFDGKGNLRDWWTAEDTAKFEARTDCLVREYNQFIAVDEVHVNGKLTLGENTADNGGLVLAYMAFLDRAKQEHLDVHAKTDGYTGAQRFYIAFAQNWCAHERPEALRTGASIDPHSPDQIRANGPIVNQPGFGAAFSCKAGAPMVPANSCRVW